MNNAEKLNQVLPKLRSAELLEKAVAVKQSVFVCPYEGSAAADSDIKLENNAVSLFIKEMKELRGADFSYADTPVDAGVIFSEAPAGDIQLVKPSPFEECAGENYRITYEGGVIVAEYTSLKGLNHALSTLLYHSETDTENGTFLWKHRKIVDGPQCKFRSFMVDLGRVWHPIEWLYQYVDLCFKYKLSHLHLHFNDFQSYTLPSEIYPGLSSPGRSYTRQQIDELCIYAKTRGVSLVPEIDVPGHCTAFENAYPELFGNRGIICQHEESMSAMRALFEELCEMFPDSEYIHIGGDEAAIALWTECEECLGYFETVDKEAVDKFRSADADDKAAKRTLAERMYAYFVDEMAKVIFKAGRRPIVWEGFGKCVNEYVSKDIIVMSWENYYQYTHELLEAGFDIINCSWRPLYIVTPELYWNAEEIYDWDIFDWRPTYPDSPYKDIGIKIDPSYEKRIYGSQMLAWGDKIVLKYENTLEGVVLEKQFIEETLPAMAVNTWNTIDEK